MDLSQKESMVIKKYKKDIILISIILLLAIVLLFIYKINTTKGNSVEVSLDGKIIYNLPLNKNVTKTISSQLGENILIIDNGYAKIIEADCPDKLCINQKSISNVGETIICLPHKLIIKITNNKNIESDLDSISN